MNSFHFPSCFSKIYFNTAPSSLLRSRKRCIPFRFPYWKLHAFLFSRIRNTHTAHIFYLFLITLILFGDVYKSWRLSFLNYLQPPLTSSLSSPSAQCFRVTPASFCIHCEIPHKYHSERDEKYGIKHQPRHKHSGTTCNEFILYKYLYM